MDSSTSSLSLEIGEDGDVDNIFERALGVGDDNRLGGQPFYKGLVAHVGRGLLWREGSELLFCKDNVFVKTTECTSQQASYVLLRRILLLNACLSC